MDHKLKLMVVDDSPLFRTWLIRSLSADDRFQIVGYAVNALDAQEKIPLLQPDMLTLDIEMPGMNGFDVVEKLNAVNCKVIIITAYSTFSYAQRALRLGVSDIIEKPIDTDTLKEAIQRAIGWEFTGNEALNKALFYIHTHYWEKIELEILAEEACCTPQSSVSFV